MIENIRLYLDEACTKRLSQQESIKPIDEKYAVAGTPATYSLWIKNESDKPIENIAFMELGFKVETEPFDLFPHEKACVSFTVQVPEYLENAPESQFTIFEVPAGFRNVWQPSPKRIVAQLEFPERVYEHAETRIQAFFKPCRFEKAQARYSSVIRMARKEIRMTTGNFKFRQSNIGERFMQTLQRHDFPTPKESHETTGTLIVQYDNADYLVLNVYLAKSKEQNTQELLLQVHECRLIQVLQNKRVYKVELVSEGNAAPFLWRFNMSQASDFQRVMEFLTGKFNEKQLLHVIFLNEGGYVFESGLLVA
jgi:hypothetical protein